MKAKTITNPFTVSEIRGGIIKDYLQEEDYMAPHSVIEFSLQLCELQILAKFSNQTDRSKLQSYIHLRVASS